MARLTPAEAAEKQGNRLKAATQDIRRGIERVTVAPGQLAAKKADKMLLRVTEAVQSGRWGQNVAAVTLAEWQAAARDKGVNRIAAGIDAARPKVEEFFNQFLPHLDRVRQEVAAMPDTSIEDAIARAAHTIRRNSEFKFKRR